MPFHTRLLGTDRLALYSFIHSLNTNFGTSVFESCRRACQIEFRGRESANKGGRLYKRRRVSGDSNDNDHSATAPGASQHLSLLAFDANEHGNATVRAVLAKHGWFQTIASDATHFTFLGSAEADLPALGLKRMTLGNRTFWIPD